MTALIKEEINYIKQDVFFKAAVSRELCIRMYSLKWQCHESYAAGCIVVSCSVARDMQ